MLLKFFGVRGLFPVPGKNTQNYGGNTSCVALDMPELDRLIIFDAGTGIRYLGELLVNTRKITQIHLFLSHYHEDHVHGFPYFLPLFTDGYQINIYGPQPVKGTMEKILREYLDHRRMPVNLGKIRAELVFKELSEQNFTLGGTTITSFGLNHPVKTLGYRIRFGSKVITYACDHEPYYQLDGSQGKDSLLEKELAFRQFISDSDFLIGDGQYLPDELEIHRGWGHGSITYLANQAMLASVKHLIVTHHDPHRSDQHLDRIYRHYTQLLSGKKSRLDFTLAREGLEYTL